MTITGYYHSPDLQMSRSLDLEAHLQMQFSVIFTMPLFGDGSYSSVDSTVRVFSWCQNWRSFQQTVLYVKFSCFSPCGYIRTYFWIKKKNSLETFRRLKCTKNNKLEKGKVKRESLENPIKDNTSHLFCIQVFGFLSWATVY